MDIDWSGVALVITATGGAIAIVINAVKTSKKVDKVHKLATSIEHAVNQKTGGEATIAEEVSDLHDDMEGKG